MSHTVKTTTVPVGTRIADHTKDAYFVDAWSVIAAEPDLTALGQFTKAARATPKWVNACMKLRNAAVQLVGLKDLGSMSELADNKLDSDYTVGERVGIFTLLDIAPDEVLLCDDDKHLKVVLSVSLAKQASGQTLVTVTTVVHVHNLLGKIYMLPVAPMHKLIAPTVAKAIGRVT